MKEVVFEVAFVKRWLFFFTNLSAKSEAVVWKRKQYNGLEAYAVQFCMLNNNTTYVFVCSLCVALPDVALYS